MMPRRLFSAVIKTARVSRRAASDPDPPIPGPAGVGARRLVAVVVAAGLLFAGARPALADDPMRSPYGPPDGETSTAKRATILTFGGLAVLSLTYVTVRAVQLMNATAEHNDFPRNGRGTIDCTTKQQCDDLETVNEDTNKRLNQLMYGTVALLATTGGVLFTSVLWPNSATRVAPAASKEGATLSVVGRF